MPHLDVRHSYPYQETAGASIQVTNVPLRTLVTGKFTRIWEFHSLPTTSNVLPRDSTQSGLKWGTPYLGSSADIYADRVLTQVSQSVPRETEISKLVVT